MKENDIIQKCWSFTKLPVNALYSNRKLQLRREASRKKEHKKWTITKKLKREKCKKVTRTITLKKSIGSVESELRNSTVTGYRCSFTLFACLKWRVGDVRMGWECPWRTTRISGRRERKKKSEKRKEREREWERTKVSGRMARALGSHEKRIVVNWRNRRRWRKLDNILTTSLSLFYPFSFLSSLFRHAHHTGFFYNPALFTINGSPFFVLIFLVPILHEFLSIWYAFRSSFFFSSSFL